MKDKMFDLALKEGRFDIKWGVVNPGNAMCVHVTETKREAEQYRKDHASVYVVVRVFISPIYPGAAKQLKLILKFMNIIKSQRYVKKRDLMRKLRMKKRDCDRLLKKAEEQGLVKTKEFTDKTVWITYENP